MKVQELIQQLTATTWRADYANSAIDHARDYWGGVSNGNRTVLYS